MVIIYIYVYMYLYYRHHQTSAYNRAYLYKLNIMWWMNGILCLHVPVRAIAVCGVI